MKKIKEVYKEVENEKGNEVKGQKMAPEMTEKDFIKEHKRLIGVMKDGSRAKLDAEIKLQQEELDECLGTKEEKDEPDDSEDID